MKTRFLPKFPVFVQDLLASMRWQSMTAEERGCYMHLLCLQWNEGGLPADPSALLILGSIHGSPADHPLVIEAFPICPDGLRRNAKCASVRSEADAYCDEQARKSALGVAARHKQPAGQPTGNPVVNPRSTPPTPTPTPTQTQTPDQIQNGSLRSPPRDKPAGLPKPRKEAAGPNADLIRHWESEWPRTRMGQEWAWTPKEAVGVARALKLADGNVAEVRNRMTRLLESPDAWLAANASPSILVSRWNQLAVEVRTNGHMNAAERMLRERLAT